MDQILRMTTPVFHCIGDSHASFFSGEDVMQPPWPHKPSDVIPFFKTYRMGAVLAESLSRYGSSLKGRELLFVLLDRKMPMKEFWTIPPGSNLLFCFGEIDCRFHIIKQAEKSENTIENIAERTALKYLEVLLEIKALGYNIIVWNAVPPTNPDKINPDYPHYGTYEERILATTTFNSTLKKRCSELGFLFLSVYDRLVNEDQTAKMEYYMDNVHLSQKAMPMVITELKKYFPSIPDYSGIPLQGFFQRIFKK